MMSIPRVSKRDKVLWRHRVEELRSMEDDINESWYSKNLYEVDAPETNDNSNHYLITFTFPYQDGRLHLGHLFTISKAEFAVRYHRMKGKIALFPFGFHCTGMPIAAFAMNLKKELESGEKIIVSQSKKSLKAKAETKVIKDMSHADVLEHMDVPRSEIPQFTDPVKWVHYFPEYGMKDLKNYGAAIDWRRSFITTDINPYFDAFVKWQFRLLKDLGYVVKDKRPTICDPYDYQPCMDHDRSSGENVMPTEYILIKMELEDPVKIDERFIACRGGNVFLLAATTRPETVVGQTNYWIKPNASYDVVKANGVNEYYISGSRAVGNLIAQDFVVDDEPLFEIESNKLIGAECKSPFISIRIRGLPLEDIDLFKGTGIVTSVPSDSPVDLQGINDLIKNIEMQEEYGIKPEWLTFEVIKIIKTQKLGCFSAEAAIKEIFNHPKFRNEPRDVMMKKAKKIAYRHQNTNGEMIIGPFAGKLVKESRDEMKKLLVSEDRAFVYYEPESIVISRTGNECVVKKLDQWYILYGTPEWKAQIIEHFKEIEVFHPEVRRKFTKCFEWLSAWACTRENGLGTRLPFEEKYIIESLSDSTIYTAYYTISHLLQGNVEGSIPGAAGITPNLIDDTFFDFIFRNGPMPKTIPEATLIKIKHEFEFFYPCSCRVSGNDLITNHLTMWLYNHAALFDPKYIPKSIRANGMLLLNGKKMSKSTGNFITLDEGIKKYSVSATRMAIADSGDGSINANFTEDFVKVVTGRLFDFMDIIKNRPNGARSNVEGFFDLLFDAKISRAIINTDSAYEKMNFKEALKYSFFDLQNSWLEYTTALEGQAISMVLYHKFINVSLLLLTPIIPQFTDFCWTKLLSHESTIINERFPAPDPYNPRIFFEERFMHKTYQTIKFRIKKNKDQKIAAVFIQNDFSDIQKRCLYILRNNWCPDSISFNEDNISADFSKDKAFENSNKNEYQPFYNFYKGAVQEFGSFLLSEKPEIDQKSILNSNIKWFMKQLSPQGVTSLTFYDNKPDEGIWDDVIVSRSQVYMPTASIKITNKT